MHKVIQVEQPTNDQWLLIVLPKFKTVAEAQAWLATAHPMDRALLAASVQSRPASDK